MINFRKEYCIEKGLNYIKPENSMMNDYIVYLEEKLNEAINFTDSSLPLKEKEKLTFDEWYKIFGYSKTVAKTYIKRGIGYSEDAMRSMYKTEYLHQL